MIFCVGLVGMGKIFLGVIIVVKVFLDNEYECLILMRFVVEVGEKLGFLLGDL